MATHLLQTLGFDPPSCYLHAPSQASPAEPDSPCLSASDEDLSSESSPEPEEASPIQTDNGPAHQNPSASSAPIMWSSFSDSLFDSPPDEDCLSNCLSWPSEGLERGDRCINRWGSWRQLEPLRDPIPCRPFFSLPKVEIEPTGVGAGLSNLGNTCFVNAVLQCFTHTVPFVQGLRSVNQKKACKCGGEDFCILCALKDHIELALNSSGGVISPSKIVENLNHISSDFQRYHQEDAHEFLVCLLDKLESCLDVNLKDTGQPSGDENLIKHIFCGRLVSKLSCCNCGHCSETHEPMNHLSLEIEDVDTLSCALESFTSVEKINLESKFECENCKQEVSVEKQLLLDQVPQIMALHLKRFKNDGSSVEKIGKHVEFPLELDLQPYTIANQSKDVELKYQLYAVVEHYGFRLCSGHYISYVRSFPDTWHMLNDSRVTGAEEKSVLSERAYIVFYARQDIPWFSSAIAVQKPCLNPDASNTSPKSVLDNVDGESASRAENIDDCMNDGSENGADGEAKITSETKNDDVVNETITAGGIKLNQYVSEPSDSTVDAPDIRSVLPGSSVCFGDQNEGKRFSGEAENVEESTSSLEKPDRSHAPDVAERRSSGPEEDSFIHSKNLKARKSEHLGSKNSSSIDRGRREALRYINSNMPSSRGQRLIQSLLQPQTPLKQKRMRSSPFRTVGPCKRRRMGSSPYKSGSPRKKKGRGSSPYKFVSSHKRKRSRRY